MQIWSNAYKQQNVLNYKAHNIPLVSAFSLYYYNYIKVYSVVVVKSSSALVSVFDSRTGGL